MWLRKQKQAIRRCRFDEQRLNNLYTINANRALTVWDVETGVCNHVVGINKMTIIGKKVRCIIRSHDNSRPYSMCAIPGGATKGQQIATGDEDGHVRTWDMRVTVPVVCLKYVHQGESFR